MIIKTRFILPFILTILVFVGLISCISSQKSIASKSSFALRNNLLFNTEQFVFRLQNQLISQSEEEEEILIFEKTGDGNDEIQSLYARLSAVLPTLDQSLKNEIYFKIALLFFYQSEPYSSLAYFDLCSDETEDFDKIIYQSRALCAIGKFDSALSVLRKVREMPNKTKNAESIFLAAKANAFYGLRNLDSTIRYLQLAINNGTPNKYRNLWHQSLARLARQNQDILLARKHFNKVSKSANISNATLLKSKIALIDLGTQSLGSKIEDLRNLSKLGVSIGNEWLLDNALLTYYIRQESIDSAIHCYDRLMNAKASIDKYKVHSSLKLTDYWMSRNEFDQAELYYHTAEQINNTISPNDALSIIKDRKGWYDLLESVEQHRGSEIDKKDLAKVKYKLVELYIAENQNDKALAELLQVLNLDPKNYDYLHTLHLLTDEVEKFDVSYYDEILASKKANNSKYAELFNSFKEGHYKELIDSVDEILRHEKVNNSYAARFAYLRAIAVGHIQSVDSLKHYLMALQSEYAAHTPIVKKVDRDLKFINDNAIYFAERSIALEKWTLQDIESKLMDNEKSIVIKNDSIAISITQEILSPISPDQTYYMIFVVADGFINLAPTRYGIGQFIRTRFAHFNVNHTLKSLGDKYQIIKVGAFESLDEVKLFENKIMDLLPEIMKVRDKKYITFVIPEKELAQLKDVESMNEYINKHLSK